jgi:hypothetical protein
MLAEQVLSSLLVFTLEPMDETHLLVLKQPIGCTQNN